MYAPPISKVRSELLAEACDIGVATLGKDAPSEIKARDRVDHSRRGGIGNIDSEKIFRSCYICVATLDVDRGRGCR